MTELRNFEAEIFELSLFGKMAYLFKTYELQFANANAALAAITAYEPKVNLFFRNLFLF